MISVRSGREDRVELSRKVLPQGNQSQPACRELLVIDVEQVVPILFQAEVTRLENGSVFSQRVQEG